MIDGVLRCWPENNCCQKSQKKPYPSDQEAHVVASGAEDGVGCIAFGSGEVASFQMAIFLQVPDERLDATASAHFAPD